jgi:hypothetical protein
MLRRRASGRGGPNHAAPAAAFDLPCHDWQQHRDLRRALDYVTGLAIISGGEASGLLEARGPGPTLRFIDEGRVWADQCLPEDPLCGHRVNLLHQPIVRLPGEARQQGRPRPSLIASLSISSKSRYSGANGTNLNLTC